MGHVGLRPQVRAKGRDQGRARVLPDAHATCAAGAFAVVVEAVAEDLVEEITVAVPDHRHGSSDRAHGAI